MSTTTGTDERVRIVPNAGEFAAPPRDGLSGPEARDAVRATRISLLSMSLGTAGLGGAWQAATGVPSAARVSDALFTISGFIWVLLLAQYLRHGGARWRNLRHDLRHPRGYALAYVPIIGILITGHFSRFGVRQARWIYAAFLVAAALIAARLLAHWLNGTLAGTTLHPGYLLPLSSAPFVASATASGLRLPGVADAAFAVGLLHWLAFGTVILGHLISGGPLPAAARPSLTVLTIPPATGGIAWTAAHKGAFNAVSFGFAGTLVFTLLLVVFLLPDLRQPGFHTGLWTLSFPVAAATNFGIRWIHATRPPGGAVVTEVLLAFASAVLVLLAGATAWSRAR